MVDFTVINDMSRQRKLQGLTGCLAVFGLVLWYFDVKVFMVSPGEYIAALAIIFFAIATVHWFDDEEKIEEEDLKK
ncbi:MAG TPA: hypothetical protein VMC84_00655 [Methanocella sp.]|uniref:hypothetical protein n=1 Tax=Methanocella sp. TaxID=2052833 RepID=UPI002B74D2C4|nr:hypothetical protein [Methanocella sp.]HTY89664.1 hypothetical protein [Methanocella sp.]